MHAKDLPAVRLSYPELLTALRRVRDAFLAERGTTDRDGPRERLRFGPLGKDMPTEFPSLEGVDPARLPEVCNEIRYDISDAGATRVRSLSVDFRSQHWARPVVYVHGVDSTALGVVADAARTAFEPHAPFLLSHPQVTEYVLLGIWMAIVVIVLLRTRGMRRRNTTRWRTVLGMVPMVAFLLLISFGSTVLPAVVAYAPQAGWWVRHSCDVLLAVLVGGVTAVLFAAIRLDARRLGAKDEAQAALDVWKD